MCCQPAFPSSSSVLSSLSIVTFIHFSSPASLGLHSCSLASPPSPACSLSPSMTIIPCSNEFPQFLCWGTCTDAFSFPLLSAAYRAMTAVISSKTLSRKTESEFMRYLVYCCCLSSINWKDIQFTSLTPAS